MKTEMNRVICSDQNPLLKRMRKLHQKKHRDSSGQFIIEGSNLIQEAIQKGIPMDALLISDTCAEMMSADGVPEAGSYLSENVLETLRIQGTRVEVVDHHLFEKLTDAQNGIEMMAIVNRPEYPEAEEGNFLSSGANCVVLDRLQDPGNIGTIIRTAVAAGYEAVIALKGTADIYSPKVLRATAGMVFDIPILFLADADELVRVARAWNKRIAVTTPVGGVPYYTCDLSRDVFLVIGNEGNGAAEEVIQAADIRVTLPMCGSIESLNAAVSAAILMYERMRG